MSEKSDRSSFLKNLGPGLLYAGAAVGVSHLVQSTKAGASFGFALIGGVILANILKYPFFEAGPRYASATGNSLIEGYQKLGNWALGIFVLFTLGTMFTIQAAVTVVTAGLASYLFGTSMEPWLWSAVILAICMAVLGFGRYALLDKLMKVIILVLSLTTLFAVSVALFSEQEISKGGGMVFDWSNPEHLLYLIPLVGWMPAPFDIAVWHSLWTLAKKKENQGKMSIRSALTDFKVGFWGTTLLAIFFVCLGAAVLWGSGEPIEQKAGAFAKQLIEMYTRALGPAFAPLIAVAAFTTMFSTTLTCLDAFPRVLRRTTVLFAPKLKKRRKNIDRLYWIWISVVAIGAVVVLKFLSGSMGQMVNFATTLSFLTAPVMGLMNYLVVTGKHMPEHARPGLGWKLLSWVGLLFLTLFSVYYALNVF